MSNSTTYEGILAVRGAKHIGFVSLPDREDDVMIQPENLKNGLDGDTVLITLNPLVPNSRQTGEVVKVVARGRKEYVGTVFEEDAKRHMKPDSRFIHPLFDLPDAPTDMVGKKVVVTITSWEEDEERPTAEIREVLGVAGEHETEMRAIMRSGGFAQDFPKDVQDEAEALYENREQIFKDAIADPKRRDMRRVPTCTIDPVDAKDFDDALSFQVLPNGNYEIGIHIADVSHYVTPGTAIDKEARERATSVYLVDRVIPMLPEILSNDLCSLRPNEDRLAFSALYEIDTQGTVQGEWYGQSIIHSDKRFTYQEAQDVIDSKEGVMVDALLSIMDISRILRKKRYENGAISFERPEVQFELDEEKKPVAIHVKHRTETMMMIEDFMLLANRRVARHVNQLAKKQKKNPTFIYRIHDQPDPEKIEDLAIFLNALGHKFNTRKGVVEASEINRLLKAVTGTPEENLIKTSAIRSMAKAIYSTRNIGHFGLAFDFYTHFTSPIRRYPDLMVHRLLRTYLDEKSIAPKEAAEYEHLAEQSSQRELEASAAERDSIKYKQVEYMLPRVGETFEAVITGVTDFGIFVQEKETQVDGLVALSNIGDDYYTHDEKKYRIQGERTSQTYRLGDEVTVKLINADLEERKLDFALAK